MLAIARADVRVTLVEPLLRRTTFLDEAVAELGLEAQVEVVRGRAEALHGHRRFAVVTARALAPLDRLLGWAMPLVEPTGVLLAMKGSTASEEISAARGVLDAWGCAEPEVRVLGADEGSSTAMVVRVAWADPGRVSWPVGAPPSRGSRQRRARRDRGTSNRRHGA